MELGGRPWLIAALVSWGIALSEDLLQVPANRIGLAVTSLPQLKRLRAVIMLAVSVPFVVLYMKQPFKLGYLWAALCLVGAVFSCSATDCGSASPNRVRNAGST
jgi:uncharacterized protein (DUF486 family)